MSINIPSTQDNSQISDNYTPDLAQSRYDFKYLVFPNDLGMSDLGHYMIININVPTALGSRSAAGRYTNQFTLLGKNERSKVDILRYGPGGPGNEFAVIGSDGSRPFVSIPRATRRIAESIALHMPSPLIYNTQNVYEEISLTALGGKLGVATAGFMTAAAKTFAGTIGRGLASGASKLAGAAGQVAGLAAQLAQTPINPMVEILFSNTTVRAFTFEVLMAPRNEKESINLKAIVKTLRFHAAPEYGMGVGGYAAGLTWIPPAEFDITFFNKGVENMNILRVNTCVLERIEVDYAPTGTYSTFRNGHPVAVRLSMGFRELEPIHKQRVLQGF
jgi:hypothetical protein